jgi:hypothetical protein
MTRTLFAQIRKGVSGHVDGGKDIDFEDGAHLFLVQFLHCPFHSISGIVDDDIDAAEAGNGLFDGVADREVAATGYPAASNCLTRERPSPCDAPVTYQIFSLLILAGFLMVNIQAYSPTLRSFFSR